MVSHACYSCTGEGEAGRAVVTETRLCVVLFLKTKTNRIGKIYIFHIMYTVFNYNLCMPDISQPAKHAYMYISAIVCKCQIPASQLGIQILVIWGKEYHQTLAPSAA